jgi:formylglycine-generating enzyme required for sulfatase activity
MSNHQSEPREYDAVLGAPTDGSSWETGTDNCRVMRGGSWSSSGLNCRSADRDRFPTHPYSAHWTMGFRVALVSGSVL